MRPLLCLFALTLSAWAESKNFSDSAPLQADGSVVIDTYKGSIRVETWNQPRVEVRARIESDGSTDQAVRDTQIRMSIMTGNVRIKTDYNQAKDGQSRSWLERMWTDGFSGSLPLVHYEIRMPATARLRIKDYKSETEVRGLRAELDLETYKGTVRVAGLDGPLRLNTYKGTGTLEFARFAGPSLVESYKGEIELRLPRDARFELDSQLGKRGDLLSDFAVTRRASGDARVSGPVNGGGPRLVLKGHRPRVELRRN